MSDQSERQTICIPQVEWDTAMYSDVLLESRGVPLGITFSGKAIPHDDYYYETRADDSQKLLYVTWWKK